jgi:hypothetical protein
VYAAVSADATALLLLITTPTAGGGIMMAMGCVVVLCRRTATRGVPTGVMARAARGRRWGRLVVAMMVIMRTTFMTIVILVLVGYQHTVGTVQIVALMIAAGSKIQEHLLFLEKCCGALRIATHAVLIWRTVPAALS